MRRLIAGAMVALTLTAGTVGYAAGSATFGRKAILKCNRPIREDSAAHPRLVEYRPGGAIVYRCSRP